MLGTCVILLMGYGPNDGALRCRRWIVVWNLPRMVFIEISTMVVSATSKTTTTGVLPVFAYTTVTCRYMTTMLACFRKSGRHLSSRNRDPRKP